MTAGYKVEIKKAFKDDTAESVSFTQDTSEQVSEVLLNASLSKKMYESNCLEVEIQTEKDIETFRNKLITLTNNNITLAKDYYIFNIKQKKEKVVLKAYSLDYFLTIDKFCQAFTAKTLVDDIIKPSLQQSQSKHFDKFREIQTGSKSGNISNCVVSNVKNFQGTVIPYAVQYNESLYDFMVRVCNRDGEFLYVDEDNKLNIGLKPTNLVRLNSLNPQEIEYVESYNESNEAGWVDKNYLLGSENNTEENTETNKKLNIAFGVLAPEYLEQVETEEYSSWLDFTHPFSEACTLVRALAFERTLKDSLLAASRVMSLNYSHYELFVLYFNSVFSKQYPKGTLLYSSPLAVEEETVLTRDNKGYQELYRIQEETKNGQLKVLTTEHPNIGLGGTIIYKNTSYVLYQINFTLTSDCVEQCEMLLVPKTTKGFYPLPMPEKYVRKASAQRAIVVDNFDPSRLGRVRVQYPWQNEKIEGNEYTLNNINSTPWIRISSPMASDGAGFLFSPSFKDEVMVDFEDGNVERPYVCGSLYNDKNRPSLPSRSQTRGIVKSITSVNGHHISFIDNGGGERYISNIMPFLKLAASYGIADLRIFDGPYSKYLGGGFEIADYYGIYSITGSTHNRSINISSPFGTVNIDAFSGISIEAPMGDVNIVGKNVNIEARNNLTITSGTNIPGYFRNKENLGIFVEPFAMINKVAGIDFSFIRTYLEVILRPIGGNMLIKSNRYMCLEAGDGETIVERDRSNNSFGSFLSCTNNKSVGDVLLNTITGTYTIIKNYNSMCQKWESLSERVKMYRNTPIQSIGQTLVTDLGVIAEEALEDRDYMLSSDECGQLRAMRRTAEEIIEIKDSLFDTYKLQDKDIKSKIEDFDSIFKSQMKNWNQDEELPYVINSKELMYKELKYTVDSQKNLSDVIEMDKWSDKINIEDAVRRKEETGIDVKSIIKTAALTATGLDEYYKLNDERAWTEREKGAILFSDDKRNFFKIATDGNLQKAHPKDYDKIIVDIINSIND